MRSDIFHGMALTGIFAVVLTVLCALLCPQILQILSTPDDIYENAYRYLFIIFLGIPFNLLYNLMSGIFRSVGDSRTPFMFLAFATVLNIGLDLFFIVVLHLGVAGAAAATVMAQALSGILCFIYMRKKMPVLHLGREDCRWSGDTVKLMLSMGLPMGLQYSITAIGSMVMQSANNGLGSVYVSGFTAGARIKQFAMCPFDALATGTSVFCSQNLGAGKMERIKTGIKQGTAVGILYGLFAGLVIIFFGRTLSLLFVSGENGAILDASARYLRCMGYFFWSLGILNVCRMCTQGLGFSVRVVFAGLLEMAARCVVSLFFVPVFGFTAICFADQSAWLSACIYIVPTCMHCVKLCADKLKNCDV